MEPSELTREGDEKASPTVPTSDASDLEDATEGTAFLLKPIPTQHPIRRVGSGRIGSVNIALLCFNLMLSAVVVMSWMGNGGETADQYHFAYDHAPLSSIASTSPKYSGLTLGDRSPYTQPPSHEVDEAWDRISAPPGDVGLIQADKPELARLNLTSIPFADGSAHSVGTIKVFHDLHCLDFLRKQIYNASHYQIPHAEYPLQDDHIAHCLDNLRQTLQCRPDLRLLPFKFIRGWPHAWADFRGTSTCVDFDGVLAWAQSRRFEDTYVDERGVEKSKLAVHPDREVLLERERKGEVSIRRLVDEGIEWLDV